MITSSLREMSLTRLQAVTSLLEISDWFKTIEWDTPAEVAEQQDPVDSDDDVVLRQI